MVNRFDWVYFFNLRVLNYKRIEFFIVKFFLLKLFVVGGEISVLSVSSCGKEKGCYRGIKRRRKEFGNLGNYVFFSMVRVLILKGGLVGGMVRVGGGGKSMKGLVGYNNMILDVIKINEFLIFFYNLK